MTNLHRIIAKLISCGSTRCNNIRCGNSGLLGGSREESAWHFSPSTTCGSYGPAVEKIMTQITPRSKRRHTGYGTENCTIPAVSASAKQEAQNHKTCDTPGSIVCIYPPPYRPSDGMASWLQVRGVRWSTPNMRRHDEQLWL